MYFYGLGFVPTPFLHDRHVLNFVHALPIYDLLSPALQ